MSTKPRFGAAVLGCAILFATAGMLSGCLSARYRRASKSTPPAVAFGASAQNMAMMVQIDSIIVCHGPGSWKRDAYWDEYVLTLSNTATEPVTITTASLVGLAGIVVQPGDDPWMLEKASREAAKAGFGLPPRSAPEIGAGAAGIGGGMAAGAAWGASTAGGLISTPAAAVLGAGVGLVLGVPIAAGATVYRNVHNRHAIEAEFARRRLALPCVIGAGQRVHGSLFFPVTPAPRTLTARCRTAEIDADLAVDLGAAGRLHLAER